VLLEGLSPLLASARLVVDVAPSARLALVLRRTVPSQYVRIDFDPAADARAVDVQASLAQLPFPESSVDVLLCYHVLEHISDDAAAMTEIARVLGDAGLALVQVPWRPGVPTDEDPDAPLDERVRRFGQADHVRYYGSDFEERLLKAGLQSFRFTPREVVGDRLVKLFNLDPDESVWLVRRHHQLRPNMWNVDGIRLRTIRMVAELPDGRVAGAELRAATFERKAEGWERAYRQLRSRGPIRLAALLSRLLTRRKPF